MTRRQGIIADESAGTGSISDGYHTFDEIYDHRVTLWIALCRMADRGLFGIPWRSKMHSDGSSFEGQFVLGMGEDPGEQITYHLPLSRWDECGFARICELGSGYNEIPKFDGHTSADVLQRIKNL